VGTRQVTLQRLGGWTLMGFVTALPLNCFGGSSLRRGIVTLNVIKSSLCSDLPMVYVSKNLN